jgi:hypothetical protein
MDQSILNFVFQKSIVTGITTIAMGINNSYIATDVDDIMIPITTILLFKCVRAPEP